MIVGFANMLIRAWEGEEPRTVFVAFDTLTVPTYRHELLAEYQSGRDFPGDLTDQLANCRISSRRWALPGRRRATRRTTSSRLPSPRKRSARARPWCSPTTATFQLASPRTTILHPKRGVSELQRVGPAEVRERYGVEPAQVPDFIALRGDPSDRIPGAPGVGPGRAAAIVKKHGSLEAALEAGGFPTIADQLREYLWIATLQYDGAGPSCRTQRRTGSVPRS